jgi:RNA polymerase sigma-70 factor (ECF subfamily)
VLLVVYLLFNEGYCATSGDTAIRHDLCAEAMRLGHLICQLLARQTEARALLALMLLHDSRQSARTAENGELILLEDQNRDLWNQEQIRQGIVVVESALRDGPAGPYALQAAIATVHARARHGEEADWPQIVALYELLLRIRSSPVVELNHAAAVAMARDRQPGWPCSTRSKRRRNFATTTCCPPPALTFCAVSNAGQRPLPPTAVPWLWSPTTPTVTFLTAAWPRWN